MGALRAHAIGGAPSLLRTNFDSQPVGLRGLGDPCLHEGSCDARSDHLGELLELLRGEPDMEAVLGNHEVDRGTLLGIDGDEHHDPFWVWVIQSRRLESWALQPRRASRRSSR